MNRFLIKLLLASALIALYGCSDDPTTPEVPTPIPEPTREEITIQGVGQHGIFDPSLAHDPTTDLLWMAYSEVKDSDMWPTQNMAVQTRLATSTDAGSTWTDSGGAINPALDLVLPLDPPLNAGTWVQEVPALVHDPGAPTAEQWKLIWMRYLQINRGPAYMHGWLSLKTAPSPAGPWSDERKLFAAAAYDALNDGTIGPPEIMVNLLDQDLSTALVLTEPGFLATDDALYVTMLAIEAPPLAGKVALLKWSHPAGPWQYQGSFLDNTTDCPDFGCERFTAPELFTLDGVIYLVVTPQIGERYQGTMVFEVTDLETATLKRVDGIPVPALEIYGTDGTHNGAAAYHEQATGSGLIYSEVDTSVEPLFFRIFKSHQIP